MNETCSSDTNLLQTTVPISPHSLLCVELLQHELTRQGVDLFLHLLHLFVDCWFIIRVGAVVLGRTIFVKVSCINTIEQLHK